MTEQEIFDAVVTHLAKQQAPGYDLQRGVCTYLDPKGKKCAVGALMNEAEMSWAKAVGLGGIAQILDWPTPAPLRPFFRQNLQLLQALQDAHDAHAGREPHVWQHETREALYRVAESFALNTQSLDQLVDWRQASHAQQPA